MDLHHLSNYIAQNIIPTKKGRKCIDGRYLSEDENSGMIACPGADFGYVMAMLGYNHEQKLGMSVVDCVKRVYDAVISLDDTFYMHTDSHENPDVVYSIGCGHAFKPTIDENANQYGLQAKDVQKTIQMLKTSQEFKVQMVNLPGEHKEEGVLIIKDEEFTVNSQEGEHMYFVYDKKRDDIFLKQLVEKLAMENIVYENFQRVSTMQLSVTLQLLAKGLPLFEVDFSDPASPEIKHIGTV